MQQDGLEQFRTNGDDPEWIKKSLSDDEQKNRQKSCSKAGYLWLKNKNGLETRLVETHCKSWQCLGCQASVRSLFALRMEYGLLTLDPSYLITLTFVVGSKLARNAYSARKVWTRWLREFRLKFPGAEYMAIPELTKKRIPHLHLVIGWKNKIDLVDQCQRQKRDINYKNILKSKCKCLTHVGSRLLHKITKGDSYVVHVKRTHSGGPGFYLGKYLSKAQDRNYFESIGFKRRWSRSPGWPSPSPLALKSVEEGTYHVDGWSGSKFGRRVLELENYQGRMLSDDDMEIIGDDLRLTMLEEKTKLRTIKVMEAQLATNNWS